MTKRPMRSREPFAIVPVRLLAEVNNSALRVYIVLAQMANVDTGRSWPSNATIAQRTGLKRTAVKDGIRQLAEKGWLTKVERPGKSSVFTVEHSGGSATRPPGGRSGDREGVVQATPNYTNELNQGSVSKKCIDCGKPADINPFTGEPNPRCRQCYSKHKEPQQDPRFQAATYRVWQPEEAPDDSVDAQVEVANIRRRLQSVSDGLVDEERYPVPDDD